MEKHSWKEWLIAMRPWSFPASAMPVAVTLGYLYWSQGDVNWPVGLFTLFIMVLFQAAGNTWSDYFDYKRGVDAVDTFGVHTLTGGQFAPSEIYGLAWGLLATSVLAGLVLAGLSGWPVLCLGAIGLLLTMAYPPLKYCAWGDAVIFLTYALLPALGTSWVATGRFCLEVLWLTVPVGLITVAILHANNTRDIPTDRRARITTLAMKLGERLSLSLYRFEVLFPFLWLVGCAFTGVFPWWTLLVLPALLPAMGNVRMTRSVESEGMQAIARLDELTAKLQLLFSMLFTMSFLLATWLS